MVLINLYEVGIKTNEIRKALMIKVSQNRPRFARTCKTTSMSSGTFLKALDQLILNLCMYIFNDWERTDCPKKTILVRK